MIQSEIIFYAFKLILGVIIAFLAILLWSKTREAAWMSLVAGAVTGYASIVCDLLLNLGVIKNVVIDFSGNTFDVFKYLAFVIPCFFIILAFILMLLKVYRENRNDM